MRAALLWILAVSTGMPFALLCVWSVSREWFYPALLPRRLTGDAWAGVVSGRLGHAAGTSVVLGLLSGLLGCALAVPVGRALASLAGWRRHVAAAVVFLPVAAPPIAFATGLQYFFLRVGLGGTLAGVLLTHLVPVVGLLSLYFVGVFTVYDGRVEDEARTLGASPAQVLARVTLPLLRRQLAEAVALGFLVSWAQVALTLVVGGGLVRTLPLEVFAYIRAGQDRFAATGALLLILPPVAALTVARLASGRTEVAVA